MMSGPLQPQCLKVIKLSTPCISWEGLLRVKVTHTKLLIDAAAKCASSTSTIICNPSKAPLSKDAAHEAMTDASSSYPVNGRPSKPTFPGNINLPCANGRGNAHPPESSHLSPRFLSPTAANTTLDPVLSPSPK